MNNETLKIDLCTRLPYGFMCKDDEDENKWVALIPMAIDEVSVKDAIVYEYKPYLFNSLTEPITINMKTFVPIVELLKIQHEQWWREKEGTRYGEIEFLETPNSAKACFSFMATKDITLYTLMPWNYPLWVVDKLNEWHVNYRLTSDQFIPATNEYA